MTQRIRVLCLLPLIGFSAPAREASVPGCGTHLERSSEELYLHRQAERRLGLSHAVRAKALAARAASTNRDFGNIAVIDDADGAVAQQRNFNLNQKTVSFIPSAPGASRYRVRTTAGSYDPAAALSGVKLEGLGDDDARQVFLPFAFPYFGGAYRDVWVNSDGNLTFTSGDAGSTDRSLGRMTGGPPRIAPLFTDLNPGLTSAPAGVRVLAETGGVVISWQSVPLYSASGLAPPQTFQVRLFPDGSIEFAFDSVSLSDGAVTGISPGGVKGSLSLISFAADSADEFAGTVADRFSVLPLIDIATVAQKFYATHQDAYDYLVIYNAVGVQAGTGVVAYEVTVRNHRGGYGDRPAETGEEFGSHRRLQSVLNLGPLYQYPADPKGRVPSRGPTGDTSLSILGHESGHLFLAFASVADPAIPGSQPMLGRALVHWSFDFNSEASFLEGNRIQDLGDAASPRFQTTATVQAYSLLDQYLMGFRGAHDVPPTFVVQGSPYPAATAPQAGISFDGKRREITVDDVIAAVGRRTPDYTVAQRRFRFAFILIAPAGQTPQPAQIAQVEDYRAAFEDFYAKATSNLAIADTSLKSAVQLSAFPAAGVLLNGMGSATLSLESPADKPRTFQLTTSSGIVQVPASVTIPAGAMQSVFAVRGVREGVDELTATPSDASYETAVARVQVASNPSGLALQLLSPDRISGAAGVALTPIQVRVTDLNQAPYSGVRVTASVANGRVDAPTVITDETGIAIFRWTPAADSGKLTAAVEGAPDSAVVVTFTGRPSIPANGIVNAASFVPGITPGSLATIFGVGLSGGATASLPAPLPFGAVWVQVLVNGIAARLSYVGDTQINLVVPTGITGPAATIEIDNATGHFTGYPVAVSAVSPGIFNGAVLIAGTGLSTFARPAHVGDTLEIYTTGLGIDIPAPQVLIGNVPTKVLGAVALTQYPGLYQINATVADGTPTGNQPVVVVSSGIRSNEVRINLEDSSGPQSR